MDIKELFEIIKKEQEEIKEKLKRLKEEEKERTAQYRELVAVKLVNNQVLLKIGEYLK